MILYYAMGGGIGHLTRSLAILRQAPELHQQVRLLVSSQHAALVRPSAPCPVDLVAGAILASRRQYLQFLDTYLQQHRIKVLVLDTFPFGIVGEWQALGKTVPRVLIARYLKWPTYLKQIGPGSGVLPRQALLVEPLSDGYRQTLQASSQLTVLEAPITLQSGPPAARPDHLKPCLIVHSGSAAERQVLLRFARQQLGGDVPLAWTPDWIVPEQGIYPAERVLPQYAAVVSAAGYNMTAIASQTPPARKHVLHPFRRRFDNQFLRLTRFKNGLWQQRSDNGAQQAAQWLRHALASL